MRSRLHPIVIVLLLTYPVGVAGLAWAPSRPYFLLLVPAHLLLSFGLLLWGHVVSGGRAKLPQLAVWLLVAVLGWAAEVLGVTTGQLFGEYQYGPPFGWQVLRTPLLIGVNWLLLTYVCSDLAQRVLRRPQWLAALLAALLMTALDFLLEPVAMALDFWHWYGERVPLQNYVAWYGFGALFSYLLLRLAPPPRNLASPWLFALQALFFGALWFFLT